MKETMLDVLRYLFDHYMWEPMEEPVDKDTLAIELEQAGFEDPIIRQAFKWLEELGDRQNGSIISALSSVHSNQSMRIYSTEEMVRLDADCRGFILFLEQTGVLDHTLRELIIDRIMALDGETIDLEQLKWVILMVLSNGSEEGDQMLWLEDVIYAADADSMIH